MGIQVLDIQTADDFAELVAKKMLMLLPKPKEKSDSVEKLPKYISKKTLCEMVEWSNTKLERYLRKSKKLKAYKIGGNIRFKLSEVEQLITEGEIKYEVTPSYEFKPFQQIQKATNN